MASIITYTIGEVNDAYIIMAILIFNTITSRPNNLAQLCDGRFSGWLVIIPIARSIILVEEIRKFLYRRKLI